MATMSDVSVALAMARTFNDSATCKKIITTILVMTQFQELTLTRLNSK